MPVHCPPAGGIGLGQGTCQGLQGNALYALHAPFREAFNYNHALLAVHQLKSCSKDSTVDTAQF